MKRLMIVLASAGLALGLLGPAGAAYAYTPPPIKVAVVKSTLTDDWSLYNKPSGTGWQRLPRQEAVAAYLASQGWDVTRVGDDVFDSVATLQQYDVIVLAHVFAMNSTPSKNLQAYVREGGGVISMCGSPRVAPEKDTGPTVYWPEHWAALLNGEAAEWGPMSEVYQTNFIVDEFVSPAGAEWPRGNFYAERWPNVNHEILSTASQILKDKGYASGDYTYSSAFQNTLGFGGFELVNLLSGNRNTTPILTFRFTNPEAANSKWPKSTVAGTYPAAVAARYSLGKSVYFYYFPDDAVYSKAAGDYLNPSGVPDRDAAMSVVQSAIAWAGRKEGTVAPIYRGGKTWASIKVYGDGIYANQYVGDDGNVSAFGIVYYRIWDPSGRKVVDKRLHVTPYVSVQPGQVRQYAWQYRPGGQLANGKYRVEVEYVTNYPWMTTHHVESVYLVRSQGLNIPTVPVASKKADVGNVYVDPNPLTPNGDGWNDAAYVNYSLDVPARVTVKVLDMWRRPIATCASANNLTPGPHGARIPATRADGKAWADGQYYVVVEALNSAGWTSKSAQLFVSRFGKMASLGTTPKVVVVGKRPISFSPNGDGVDDVMSIDVTASADAYAVVKVLSWTGELRTIANNVRMGTEKTFVWDGKDSAGRVVPPGNYRIYVVVHGGGTSRESLWYGLSLVKR